jgi:hypothetical protein
MWHTTWILGYRVVAKIYDAGSKFGIGSGRVSKLQIFRGNKQLLNYDRGMDFSLFPHEFVDHIVSMLEHMF